MAAERHQGSDREVHTQSRQQIDRHSFDFSQLFGTVAGMWLLTELPAFSEEVAATDFSQGSFSSRSYYVTLGLFLLSLPGLWSLIKRAPKATKKRKVFEVEGPGKEGGIPLDVRARAIFQYFKKYNYEVKETGDVIRFVGNYQASRGQAAALVFYTFLGLASTALVLSIAAPGGSYWYALTLLAPAAGSYYLKKGDREEEFAVKMVTEDNEMTTDIVVEGDVEEIERFCKELQFTEKGKVYVKGLLER